MKILYPISYFYPAQTGGPANTIYWLAKSISKEIDVYVVTTVVDIKDETIISKANKWFIKEGVKIIYTDRKLFKLKFYYHILKAIPKIDIVHLNSLFDPITLPVSLLCILFKKKIVLSVRGELEEYALKSGKKKLKKILILMVRLIKRYLIFHSTSKSEVLNIGNKLDVGSSKITLIPNYLELPIKIDNCEVDNKKFLFIGRINPIKAIHKLIEGISLSKDFKTKGYRLIIAGVGKKEYTNELKVLCNKLGLTENIFFTGKRIEGLEKEELYATSFFTFLVSESENFGAVVVESLAQGTPVITSKNTPWDSVLKNNSGFWVENTPDSLSKIIDKVINLPHNEYMVLRENAYTHVKSDFDIDYKKDEWVKFYTEALN